MLAGRNVNEQGLLKNHGVFRNRVFPILKKLKESSITPKSIHFTHYPLEETPTLGEVMTRLAYLGGYEVTDGDRSVVVHAGHLRALMERYGLRPNNSISYLKGAYLMDKLRQLYAGSNRRILLHYTPISAGYVIGDDSYKKINTWRNISDISDVRKWMGS